MGAAWAPDDTAIAFMQPIDQAPPSKGAPLPALRARLAIATVGAWQVRVVDEVVVEIGPTEYAAPTLRWTPDGRAMYWKDANGGHVVDVASGHLSELPLALDGATDLQWQPVP